ncbi:OLC1v1011847C1 [Oldenlandia corymbosa var. corymbosa]|uniref:Peroxidase n=1 Tax=Oldenlandia corymbosa var. corymbosa TaxID=529605 RepID=A0AAV1DV65_OLDCO|nr:OLC1v1011847C1 [Oldenlandia corymbosa var. corymbosa]
MEMMSMNRKKMWGGKGWILVMMLMSLSLGTVVVESQLAENFYSSTCPNLEDIVLQSVKTKLSQTAPLTIPIPATLRLFFHDCFVEGCDGSILIASPNMDAEKDAEDNLSLAGDGFDTVIQAKAAVESQCPGVVSCADILAIAARDVVVLAGGPWFNVELGRKDGVISSSDRVPGNLPKPTDDWNTLKLLFAKNNLTTTELVALSGAHTVGFSHCSRFSGRLYSNPTDPSLDPDYAQQLKQECPPNPESDQVVVKLDPTTPDAFDNAYYRNLVAGKGLLTSDQELFSEPSTQDTVTGFANGGSEFFAAFGSAMRSLGRTGVKTGNQGEVRRDCTAFNSALN